MHIFHVSGQHFDNTGMFLRVHASDSMTTLEEVMRSLDNLIRAGKHNREKSDPKRYGPQVPFGNGVRTMVSP